MRAVRRNRFQLHSISVSIVVQLIFIEVNFAQNWKYWLCIRWIAFCRSTRPKNEDEIPFVDSQNECVYSEWTSNLSANFDCQLHFTPQEKRISFWHWLLSKIKQPKTNPNYFGPRRNNVWRSRQLKFNKRRSSENGKIVSSFARPKSENDKSLGVRVSNKSIMSTASQQKKDEKQEEFRCSRFRRHRRRLHFTVVAQDFSCFSQPIYFLLGLRVNGISEKTAKSQNELLCPDSRDFTR